MALVDILDYDRLLVDDVSFLVLLTFRVERLGLLNLLDDSTAGAFICNICNSFGNNRTSLAFFITFLG